MTRYIELDALVAEIERRIEHNTKWKNACKTPAVLAANQAIEEDKKLLSIIDTLEVKEVDFDEEFDKFHIGMYNPFDSGAAIRKFAKHFFELGLQTSNPLTWEDMMIIHKCCKDAINYNLYAWQTAEGQQKIYKDILKRFKAQKGE